MKKRTLIIFLLFSLMIFGGCTQQNDGEENNADENPGDSFEGTDFQGDEFVLKATVNGFEGTGRLSVEIVESDYAFGTYIVLVGEDTVCVDSNGNSVGVEQINSGDMVKITYGGQVMMSYPPQIAARKIVVLK